MVEVAASGNPFGTALRCTTDAVGSSVWIWEESENVISLLFDSIFNINKEQAPHRMNFPLRELSSAMTWFSAPA